MARTKQRKSAQNRLLRRRDYYMSRAEGATMPVDRAGAAADYLKAVLADLPPDEAGRAATEMALKIFEFADELAGVEQ